MNLEYEQLAQWVGVPKDQLRRPKDKAVRQALRDALPKIDDRQMRLRAHLSMKKRPATELCNEQLFVDTLNAQDCVKSLSLLSTTRKVVDGTPALRALVRLVRQSATKDIQALPATLKRVVARWKTTLTVRPSDSTFNEFIRVLLATIDRLPRYASSSRAERAVSSLIDSVELVLQLGLDRAEFVDIDLLFTLLISCHRKFPTLTEDRIERQSFSDVAGTLWDLGRSKLKAAATNGDASFDSTAQLLRSFPRHAPESKILFDELYNARSGYTDEIQRLIARHSGRDIEVPDSPPTPGTGDVIDSQMAGVLLQAWTHRDESAATSNLYDNLLTILKEFYRLELVGVPGQIDEFNPRKHELADPQDYSRQVRIVKPLVQTASGITQRVVIRALVESIKE